MYYFQCLQGCMASFVFLELEYEKERVINSERYLAGRQCLFFLLKQVIMQVAVQIYIYVTGGGKEVYKKFPYVTCSAPIQILQLLPGVPKEALQKYSQIQIQKRVRWLRVTTRFSENKRIWLIQKVNFDIFPK